MCIRVSDNYVSVMYRCGTSASNRLLEDQGRPRPEAGPAMVDGPTAGGPPAGEAERVLRRVEWNLTALTRTVPMAEIEDLPPSMQPHVVGVPWTWVQLFLAFGKCRCSLRQGQQALPLARLDYLRAEGTFVYF
jgi:hypothetical protein